MQFFIVKRSISFILHKHLLEEEVQFLELEGLGSSLDLALANASVGTAYAVFAVAEIVAVAATNVDIVGAFEDFVADSSS